MNQKPTAIISGPIYQTHQTGKHPESAIRAEALQRMVNQLLAEPDSHFVRLEPVRADVEQIATVHDRGYIRALKEFCEKGGGPIDINTNTSRHSYDVALYAAGGLLNGVQSILQKDIANAFALVRPPGHHAIEGAAMGFCLFNNVAIAARYLIEVAGLQRIMVVDWDVHHGNGTQDTFYNDHRVLFISSHQSNIYPGTGSAWEIGTGKGKGYNVNLPLPSGSGDAVMDYVFEVLIEPLATRYKPEFILVSAGYDGHWRDPLGQLNVSAEGYARMTKHIMQLADTFCEGRVALALEGGYDIQALISSVQATLRVLSGTPPEEAASEDQVGLGLGGHSPEAGVFRDLWSEIRELHGV
jgi:acetoin utilization deacetylase AcuC-like enzyme